MFTEQDQKQFQSKGLSEEKINLQIENFRNGFPFLKLNKAATLSSGIHKLSEKNKKSLIKLYDDSEKSVVKFVPASGAASRMFKFLFEYLNNQDDEEEMLKLMANKEFYSVSVFFDNIKEFAFYHDLAEIFLKESQNLDSRLEKMDFVNILSKLLLPDGLNYGQLPKGLIKFHRYVGYSRTSFEEHLVEGALHAKNPDNTVKIHFTVSPEHIELFKKHLSEIEKNLEEEYGVKYQIEFSIQKSSTDIIAVDLENMPFRESDKKIHFRPGGHGALIENLSDLDADIIFIKNIDNIAPDRMRDDTIDNKKLIAGVLLKYQNQIFEFIELLNQKKYLTKELKKIKKFLNSELCIGFPDEFEKLSIEKQAEFLFSKLNRPIRVCGMVKNEGEPGGGPFWAQNPDGSVSLQIVESSQIDKDDDEQNKILKNATHFNPVDLVCSIKDYRNQKFNLNNYIDPQTGFISLKSKDGKQLKAQELPGLWNGAMSDWNTIFVEVPISTFNPVKVINDLIKEEHRP